MNPGTFVLFLVLPRHLVNTDMQARFQTVPRAEARTVWETEVAAEALIFIHAPTKRQFFAVLSGLKNCPVNFFGKTCSFFQAPLSSSPATPSRQASPPFQRTTSWSFRWTQNRVLRSAGILYKLHPMRVRSCAVARGEYRCVIGNVAITHRRLS